MTASNIQAAVWRGYGKVAAAIGFPYQQFRPSGANNPTSGTPLNASLMMVAGPRDAGFTNAPEYEKPERRLYLDGTQTQVGDYLTGGPLGTLAIISQDSMLPIMGIVCNRVVTIKRPAAAAGLGVQPGYGGDIESAEVPLMVGWPAYIGMAGRGTKGAGDLPGDVEMPRDDVRLPMLAGVTLYNGDVMYDDAGRRYKLISAEETSMGWKIVALLSMT